MKTTTKSYQTILFLTLFALAALGVYAQRTVNTARSQNPNLTWAQALAKGLTGGQPPPAPISRNSRNAAFSPATNPDATAMEPAQAGGSFNITQSVVAGGGERSTGGSFDQTGTAGQSALGEASGGAFSVSGGFWQGSACSAPVITQQPQGQTACTGSSVTFTVAATGTNLTYQWRKNTANIPGANGSSYNLASVVAGDAGSYDVVITGDCGTVTSNAATLTVNAGASISQQPQNQTVCVTQAASFSVTASGTGLTYQWRKGGVNIPGAINPTYNIASTTLADAGVYDVVIAAACGNLTSMTATLTVNPTTVINTPPANQTVCVGAPANFSILATGANLTYQWRKNGSNIPGATGSSYSILAVVAGDAGNYDVVVTGACGTATSPVGSLSVNPATAITAQPANQAACLGGPAIFSVTATGANLTYQWRKNGVNIGGATGSTYALAAVTAGDAGNYSVVVTGTCGTVTSNNAALTITPDTVITAQPTNQTACAGAAATFTVAATGANLTYQWRKGGVNIGGATSATYNIASVAATDAGSYDVVVTGTCGVVTSNQAALMVNATTAITTQPANQTACLGASVGFSVVAAGNNLTYQWRKNGSNIAGATSATYNIASVAATDAGSYDVVVTGTCGVVASNQAALTVNPATVITTHPASQNVSIGGGVTFSVAATGTGTLGYQWRKNGVNIPGATASSYSIASAAPGDAGNYDALVTGTCGSVTSNPATLTVGCQTVTVNPANTALPAGTMGTPYSQSFTQSGGLGAIVWSIQSGQGSGLPGGLTLNTSTGELSGTPTATGNFSFTIRATDANNCFGERTYTLTVNAPPCPTVSGISPNNGAVGATVTITGANFTGVTAVKFSNNLSAGFTIVNPTTITATVPTGAITGVIAISQTNCADVLTSVFTVQSGNGLQFYPLPQPVRLLDTRAGLTGCTTPGAIINAGGTFTLPARTTCTGIPANAQAVTGNVTVVPSGGGFLTLYPSSAAQPTVANSNFGPGEVTNNVFTVGLGAGDGAFKIFASATTHVIVDVTGYYAPPALSGGGGLYFHPLATPVRLLETRAGLNGCIAPGAQLIGTGDPNADPNLDFAVQGRSPVAA
ncbi:MAG TPA: putative Ig domain-containing protein, partial [Blastocatellia bacterium]|nr:putative Ig domain-containing protein [Blastocatellia bacterium]